MLVGRDVCFGVQIDREFVGGIAKREFGSVWELLPDQWLWHCTREYSFAIWVVAGDESVDGREGAVRHGLLWIGSEDRTRHLDLVETAII
jgi:hypothetical protein